MGKTKILYISHSAAIAGAEVCLLTLLKYLNKEKFEPVVVFPSEGPLKEKIEGLGVRTYITPLEWWIDNGFQPSDIAIFDRVNKISDIISIEKPDIVHTNTSVIWEGAIAAKYNNIRHVWHIHEKLDKHPSLTAVLTLKFVYMIMNMLSDRIVAVSKTTKESLMNFLPSNKVSIIYNGIDRTKFQPLENIPSLREELGLNNNTFLAVTIGALIREKGIDILLDAAKLVKMYGGNVRFIIVGPGSREAIAELQKQIDEVDLKDFVYYLGFREDIPRIINSADILVLSSRTEAFPLVVLEAMAACKTVLATKCGGPEEMITDGETGYLVPANDYESLGRKILDISNCKEKLESIGKAARKRFEENFKAENYAKNFEELYIDLLNSKITNFSDDENLLLDSFVKVYNLISEKTREIIDSKAERDAQIAERDAQIAERDAQIAERDAQIAGFLNSRSWKITSPIRKLNSTLKKYGVKLA